ncbi:efflux transporter outer membrane subunit [Rhodoferax sp.]|uniref:efflux transporter outer membrane subunit n=1 Tax=Rhodoferax sp. TaxID=50421 RepID=UPI002850F9D0|nr:efflux transporter outer membrane subunit [Rhodoferax sp.]MDR3367536.1 efflux transporter outer membrane subunit [Rhodoferax sp.]
MLSPLFFFGRSGLALLCVALSGCAAVGPTYHAPAAEQLSVPDQWQAAVPHAGDTQQLLTWWSRLNDPALTRLLQAAEASNPSLQKASANIASARANTSTARASGQPTLTGSASASRNNTTTGNAQSTTSGGLDASWEIDLFGSVRRSAESADALLQARQADWHDARVSLAAEVATDYITYRACQLTLLSTQADARSSQTTANVTRRSMQAGMTSRADAYLADASAASASANAIAQQAECDVTVKALVALTGMTEPTLRQQLNGQPTQAPKLPALTALHVSNLPVNLLSQRPDLVSAERALAAASAQIGVAEADRYPRLSLQGSLSATRAAGVNTTPWSFGPSLSLPLLNGGAKRAAVDSAQAAYDLALASYRQAVRTAVQEVEQNLVRQNSAELRTADVQRSAAAYRNYANAVETNWRAGGDSLLNLELARRNAIAAEQTLITVQRDQLLYGIALYKAVGGGWTVSTGDTP